MPPPPPTDAVLERCDKMAAEYMLYRGFINSHQALLNEFSTNASLPSFCPAALTSAIIRAVTIPDFRQFLSLWDSLKNLFFVRVDSAGYDEIGKIEVLLFKLYLVSCLKCGEQQKVFDFFTWIARPTNGVGNNKTPPTIFDMRPTSNIDWVREWYALPFVPNPSADPIFSVYYHQNWKNSISVGLNNLLSAIISATPLPRFVFLERWSHSDEQLKQRSDYRAAVQDVESLKRTVTGLEEDTILLTKVVSKFVQFYHSSIRSNFSSIGIANKSDLFVEENEAKELKARLQAEGTECLRLANLCSSSGRIEDREVVIDNATVLAETALKWLNTLQNS
ncbi:hypothetical protein ScalyP_jg6272 [Parmales sp. scaly parma]|nr:hypothetical protein ScalyP_jg6272 [Parmales sp. scaly parma]